MIKVAISLSFIDAINKSWHPFQTFGSNLNPLFKKCKWWQVSHSFDLLFLVTSIPSETAVIS